jgi:hypothetical protein
MNQYPLPSGWADDQVVAVLGEAQNYHRRVRDVTGREEKLPHLNLDGGSLYRIDDESGWLQESNPRVLDAMAAKLEVMRSKEVDSAIRWAHEESIHNLEKILKRHGR